MFYSKNQKVLKMYDFFLKGVHKSINAEYFAKRPDLA